LNNLSLDDYVINQTMYKKEARNIL